MKTVIRRPMVERWAPYQSADILREVAKVIRELDSPFYEDDDWSEEDCSDTASDTSGETLSDTASECGFDSWTNESSYYNLDETQNSPSQSLSGPEIWVTTARDEGEVSKCVDMSNPEVAHQPQMQYQLQNQFPAQLPSQFHGQLQNLETQYQNQLQSQFQNQLQEQYQSQFQAQTQNQVQCH